MTELSLRRFSYGRNAAFCRRRDGATTIRTLLDLHWYRDADFHAIGQAGAGVQRRDARVDVQREPIDVERLRGMVAFESVDKLVAQMDDDVARAREILAA